MYYLADIFKPNQEEHNERSFISEQLKTQKLKNNFREVQNELQRRAIVQFTKVLNAVFKFNNDP